MARPAYLTLRVLTIVGALSIAACVLALAATQTPAEAAFPGKNGKIAVYSNRNTPEHTNPEGDLEIFTMEPEGSDIEQLTDNGADDLLPAFSPDGKQITFLSSRDGNSEIYTINADGSNQTRLTHNAAYDADTSVSPEGEITFTSDRDGNFEVYTMNADGSNQTRITNNPASDRAADWQPLQGSSGCTIKGTTGVDFLKGTSANDVICAKGGNDILIDYKGGNDTLFGDRGKDILLDVKGKGILKGGDGNDALFALDSALLDRMDGQAGNDFCVGDKGDVRTNCERGSLLSLSEEERKRLAGAKRAAGL